MKCTRKQPPAGERSVDALAMLIAAILHEPEREARRIAVGALHESRRSLDLWERLAKCTRPDALRLAEQVECEHLEQIADYIDRSRRGALVTTIHAGGYLLGLLRLRNALRKKRRILIVRKKQASAIESQVFDQFSRPKEPVEVVRHDERRTIRLIRALREGAIVVALFDLPAGYGQTHPVEMLGHTMHLVRGPTELARLGNADIIPFFCQRIFCQRGDGEYEAQVCSPIRVRDSREAAVNLANLASAHIRRHPAQWQHWHHVPEMLTGGQTDAA